jgi:benzoyl-CoA 2,3-dioxygenase component B
MLKEESHHMFVGTTGIDRVVERTAQLMVEHDTDDVVAYGAIPLTVIQKYLNFHYSVSLDLFGSETSTNVANYFTSGVKGRWSEERRRDDHVLTNDSVMVDALIDGEIGQKEVAALVGLNTDLRREYISDCQNGVNRWNKILDSAGLPQRLALPHVAFNRRVGAFRSIEATPTGEILSEDQWNIHKGQWLPTDVDKAHVRSLMRPVYEPGKIAAWIAPPRQGINGKPFDYDYVHLT